MKKKLTLALLALALLCACTSPTVESTPPATLSPDPSPAVSSDPALTGWSALDGHAPQEDHYTRYYEQPTDALIPVEGGYGATLIPFAGAVLDHGWDWPEYLYGLATPDGVVVCDPVYSYIYHPSVYDHELLDSRVLDSFLILDYTVYEAGEEDGTTLVTLAASDGSWVLEEGYVQAFPQGDGRMLLMDGAESFWLCDSAGTLTPSPLTAKPTQMWGEWWREMGGFQNGIACLPALDGDEESDEGENGSWLANVLTGETKHLPEVASCYGWYDGGELAGAFTNEENGSLAGFLDRQGNWAIPPIFQSVDPFLGDYARVHLTTGEAALIDSAGEVVLTLLGDSFHQAPAFDGELLYWDFTLDGETGQYLVHGIYDGALTPLPDHPALGQALDILYSVPAYRDGAVWVICDKDGTDEVEADGELFDADLNHLITFASEDESYGLYDCIAGKWIIPLGPYGYAFSTGTGADRLYWAASLDEEGYFALIDAEGAVLAHINGQISALSNGYLEVTDDLGSGWLDRQGNWVFRWLFPGVG